MWKELSKYWEKLSYWKKGAVVGFLIGFLNGTMLLYAIIGNIRAANHPILSKIMFNDITNAPVDWSGRIVHSMGCVTSPCILEAVILSILIYGLAGIIIGLSIGEMKNLKS